MGLFYVEIAMRKAIVKKEKNSATKLAESWYFTHV
jgi:hypothetical protein